MLTSTIDGTGTGIFTVAPPPPDDDKIGDIMQPAGYRVLVEIRPPDESKRWLESTLEMPPEVRDREWQAQIWAVVIRLGPQAYNNKEKYGEPWCKPGDRIMMRPYVGTRFMVRGRLYALINDDTVQAIISDVSELERA